MTDTRTAARTKADYSQAAIISFESQGLHYVPVSEPLIETLSGQLFVVYLLYMLLLLVRKPVPNPRRPALFDSVTLNF